MCSCRKQLESDEVGSHAMTRTRSRDPVSPLPSNPSTRCRKRQSIAPIPEEDVESAQDVTALGEVQGEEDNDQNRAASRKNKKPRHSAPEQLKHEGPNDQRQQRANETGLTASTGRMTLLPNEGMPCKNLFPKGSRRATMPAQSGKRLDELEAAEDPRRYMPLRQTVDDRGKRRIRRRRLSEEQNSIYHDRREDERKQLELDDLLERHTQDEETNRNLRYELEKAMQSHDGLEGRSADNLLVMQEERDQLRREMAQKNEEVERVKEELRGVQERLNASTPENEENSRSEPTNVTPRPQRAGRASASTYALTMFESNSSSATENQGMGPSSANVQSGSLREVSVQEFRHLRQQLSDANRKLDSVRAELRMLGFTEDVDATQEDAIYEVTSAIARARFELTQKYPGEIETAEEGANFVKRVPEILTRIANIEGNRERLFYDQKLKDVRASLEHNSGHGQSSSQESQHQKEAQALKVEVRNVKALCNHLREQLEQTHQRVTEQSVDIERHKAATITYRKDADRAEILLNRTDAERQELMLKHQMLQVEMGRRHDENELQRKNLAVFLNQQRGSLDAQMQALYETSRNLIGL